MPPEPAAPADAEEGRRARLAAALFAFAAVVQLLVGPKDVISLIMRFVIAVPSGFLAVWWWRGRRPRVASVAFALLWSAFNVVAALQFTRFADELANQFGVVPTNVPGWFIPLFTTTSTSFTTATVVIVTGAPSRRRRLAGGALAALFALLFLAEQAVAAG